MGRGLGMDCGGNVKWWGGSVQMFLTVVVLIGVCLSVGSVGAEEGQITTTTTTTTTSTSTAFNSTSEVPTTSTPSSSSASASFASPSSSSLSTLGSTDTDSSSSVPTTIKSTVTSSTSSSPVTTTAVPTTTNGTGTSVRNSSAEPLPVPVDEPRQGKSVASELEGNAGENSNSSVVAAEDDARVFYDRCADRKNKLVCYGDRSNCIRTRNCTFVGAISENDSFISVELLTRVYNPPYDGVNLTVELSKDKKGNESVLRCSRPRFKSFQIRISWKTKTSYEPGNETQTARTLIDKNQLISDCLADQATASPNENGTNSAGNNNNGRQQALALKFYIQNNNTLVSQGLAHVPVQEPKAKTSDVSSTTASNSNSTSDSSNRQARLLNNADSPPQDNPEEKSSQEREDVLYKMCLKPTAKCFGDRSGCTEGHNCTILGVLRENSTNYNLYVVTKVYNPPVEHINLTLTLGTGMLEMDGNENDNSTNSTMSHDHHVECDKPVFKDLSVQTIWRTSQPIPLPTNESQFLETTVEKMKLRNKCATDLDNLNGTDDVSIREAISFLLKFHLKNGSLVPLEVLSELSSGNDSDLFPEAGAFEIGRNGTAYLISDNNASLVILDDENIVGESRATAISSGVSPTSAAATTSFFTFVIVSSPILIFTNLKHLLFL